MPLLMHVIQCRIRGRPGYFINLVRPAWPGQNVTQLTWIYRMTWPGFNPRKDSPDHNMYLVSMQFHPVVVITMLSWQYNSHAQENSYINTESIFTLNWDYCMQIGVHFIITSLSSVQKRSQYLHSYFPVMILYQLYQHCLMGFWLLICRFIWP